MIAQKDCETGNKTTYRHTREFHKDRLREERVGVYMALLKKVLVFLNRPNFVLYHLRITHTACRLSQECAAAAGYRGGTTIRKGR